MNAANDIESIVLAVHRRNGGRLDRLDLSLKLLDPSLGLDSLDLAEIVVAIEKEFLCSPFDSDIPPSTWQDILRIVEAEGSVGLPG